jgi:hypothetical protein
MEVDRVREEAMRNQSCSYQAPGGRKSYRETTKTGIVNMCKAEMQKVREKGGLVEADHN